LGSPEGIEKGGLNFDDAIFGLVRQRLGLSHGTDDDPAMDARRLARLKRECVEVKEALSVETAVMVAVDLPGLPESVWVTRGEFEECAASVVDETVGCLQRVVNGAGVRVDALAAVVLVGGSAKIPLVSQRLTEWLGRPPALSSQPKMCVAMGAALGASVTTPPPHSAQASSQPVTTKPAAQARFAVGEVVGDRYKVEALIATGGMAEVWRAMDEHLSQPVALKVPRRGTSWGTEPIRRLRDEQRILKTIDNHNILPILDVVGDDETPCLVIRYVPGPTENARPDLAVLMENEQPRFEPSTALAILAKVAAALDAAHEVDQIHRDVKPANILLDRSNPKSRSLGDSRVFLADFGLAKQTGSSGGLTVQGSFVGTPEYMAPERFHHGPPDRSVDVYALGCVAFEMLAGKTPYVGNPDELVAAHSKAQIPKLSERRRDLPRDVDAVIERALAKDPADRPESAGRLVADLREALQSPRRHRAWLWLTAGLAGLAVAALITAFLWSWTGPTWPDDPSDAPISLQRPRDWTPHPSDAFTVLSPTDLRTLFTSQDDPNQSGWPNVIERQQTDPTDVVGMYVHEHKSGFNLDDNLEQLQADIEADLGGHRIDWDDASDKEEVAGQRAVQLDGTIRPLSSTDALRVRSYLVELDASQPHTVHLAFFAPSELFKSYEHDFDDIVNSVTITNPGR
jgi:serine/threonine-protein kinase